MDKLCSIEGCTKPVKARGWCAAHHQTWRVHGDVNYQPPSPGERFLSRITIEDNGCWFFEGGALDNGYIHFGYDKKVVLAHRFAYTMWVGPIPDGKQIDHQCHNRDGSCMGGVSCRHRRCVNPEHLEIATPRQNMLRGNTLAAENASKTHCPEGHPLEGDNLVKGAAGRSCKICAYAHQREYRKQRAESGPECSIDGCTRKSCGARGWCNPHYDHYRAHGHPVLHRSQVERPPELPVCEAEGCERTAISGGICQFHINRKRAAAKRAAKLAEQDEQKRQTS